MNLIEYAQYWLVNYKADVVKATSYRNYRYAIRYTSYVLGDSEIEDVDTLMLKNAFVKMKDMGYSKNTIRLTKRVLTQVFEQAIQDKLIWHNPVTKAEIPADAKEKYVNSYTESEYQRLVEKALEDNQGDVILFLLFTGLRRAELCALKWSDYNPAEHSIYIRNSKTESGVREVFLSHSAEYLLRRQPHYPHGYAFSTTRGAPISVPSLKNTCRRLKKVTGNESITLHRCRHTFCSRLSDSGVNPKIIAELAGHSNVSFTMQRYVHPSREQKIQAVYLLDGAEKDNNK